ncbi:MAG: DUF1844 domain-containing protein [Deltaproteobacteria bacterium]|nr:DUF1844 domain-containing protein [Deltaproteobacteria bacterium]MBW2612501.1 DUF1844 domain-containing protein [Deltaproteobacteria bacterium]MBW2635108.1 DUF1844 domain-containing protein [Deltaproteobacteria bacterium]MBW2677627.1 DUF1844 domain-containing protein [Deltaproteobacteria bacterium]
MVEEKKDFVVKDKRIFSEEDQADAAREESSDATDTEAGQADGQKDGDYPFPELNFPTFIFSLNSSALLNLGVIEDPGTGEKAKNLPLAKQTIDILGILEEKTKGNLTEDEAGMLKNFLFELRMLYVKEKG